MAVLNIHQRGLACPHGAPGALIDRLASGQDGLWPWRTWPPMRFDRPLAVGARGGHGPVRYTVTDYVPGRWIRFGFTGPRGFLGFHEFTVSQAGDGAVLRHTLAMQLRGPARLSWPLVFRPLHDALIEDSLDCAEHATTEHANTEQAGQAARWSLYVRVLRRLLRGAARSSAAPRSATGSN
jgi:hypothetical protein